MNDKKHKRWNNSDGFDIAPFEGDWKDSLMECGK